MATHEDAFKAVMTAIQESADRIGPDDGMYEHQRAAALRDLAAAYRHLRGGQQPGSVHVESK